MFAVCLPERCELGDSFSQVVLIHNVVAVEHGPRLVARQQHRDVLGDACADKVAHGTTAEVMGDAPDEPWPHDNLPAIHMLNSSPTDSGVPRRIEILDPLTTTLEHKEAVPRCPTLAEQCLKIGEHAEGEGPPFPTLGRAHIEPHHASLKVHLSPCERQDLRLTPTGEVEESGDRAQRLRERGEQRLGILRVEEPGAGVMLLRNRELGPRGEQPFCTASRKPRRSAASSRLIVAGAAPSSSRCSTYASTRAGVISIARSDPKNPARCLNASVIRHTERRPSSPY